MATDQNQKPLIWKFWMEWRFPCYFNENTESVVSPYFSNESCSTRNMLWSPTQGTIGWYAFECKATQVMQNRFSHYGGLSLCYITVALQGCIGHGNETHEKQQSEALCQTEISPFQNTHTHTHPYPFRNPIKVAWITILFDFCPVFPLNSLSTLDSTSHFISTDQNVTRKCSQHVEGIILTES